MNDISLPNVSIIIPAFNAEKHIGDCLNSVLKINYPKDKTEIIVVDNASTDKTREIIKSMPVKYLYEYNRGVSFARNKGILNATGDIIAFTDSDCLVSSRWLKEIVEFFTDPRVGGVAGEIAAFIPTTPAERYAARIRHLSPKLYLNRPRLPFAVFANLAFRREVFDKTGLLDEKFLIAGESTDFCTRFFRNTDYSLEYAPSAVVFHRHRKTTKQFIKQQWNYGKSHALLYIKYNKEVNLTVLRSLKSYAVILNCCFLLLKKSILSSKKDEVEFYYFQLIKKLSEKLGFIRQSLASGYLYL